MYLVSGNLENCKQVDFKQKCVSSKISNNMFYGKNFVLRIYPFWDVANLYLHTCCLVLLESLL